MKIIILISIIFINTIKCDKEGLSAGEKLGISLGSAIGGSILLCAIFFLLIMCSRYVDIKENNETELEGVVVE